MSILRMAMHGKAKDRRKFASLQCIDSAIDFVADLYDLSIDEVKRAMD